MSTRKSASKIFINYRRDDTRGEAGRLMDSLTEYMGEGRVFRDIEGIEGGANFEEVLQESVGSANALIVLIGPNWLNATNSAGERRLDNPDDWVAKEIIAAMDKGLPVYPVLVEDAQMPHADELPEGLKPLARYNAVNLSDKRWHFDVTRLAKVIAFDLPGSVAERTLGWVRLLAVIPLLLTTIFTVGLVTCKAAGLEFCKAAELETCHGQTVGPTFMELWQSGVSFVVIMGVAILLLVFARLVDESRRIYFYASGVSGLLGTLICFIWLVQLKELAHEPIMAFFGSTVTISLMFAFMCLSGFKPR